MANSEEEQKPCKIEKPSSPAKDEDHNAARVYPDWAMMQAYYGPQFTVPPYLNSAVASPHIPPPYMWMVPPQYMVPPYGASYPGYFSHEGAYGHPGASMAGTSVSVAMPAESSGNTGGGLVKESGDSQGLPVSTGNGNAEHGPDRRLSESEVTDDSGDGINGVKEEAGRSGLKRRRAGSPKSAAKCGKDSKKGSVGAGRGYKSMKVEKMENTSTAPDLKDPSILDVKPVAAYKPQQSAANEAPLQNTPIVPEVKWEKRKQSNRESARRSRLRKLAEAKELAATVQTLITENISLKSELSEFANFSKKLELENSALMERLKNARPGEVDFHGVRAKPVDTVNLLARVESNGSAAEGTDEEDGDDSYEQRSPVAKLHQLLDAVAAS